MSEMKYISEAEKAVEDALCGLKCLYPVLFVDKKNRIVLSNQVEFYIYVRIQMHKKEYTILPIFY